VSVRFREVPSIRSLFGRIAAGLLRCFVLCLAFSGGATRPGLLYSVFGDVQEQECRTVVRSVDDSCQYVPS
jgi:hypothetical protein